MLVMTDHGVATLFEQRPAAPEPVTVATAGDGRPVAVFGGDADPAAELLFEVDPAGPPGEATLPAPPDASPPVDPLASLDGFTWEP